MVSTKLEKVMKELDNEVRTTCKKVASHSPGLVDFVAGLVSSVDHMLDGQVKFLGKFLRKFGIQMYCNW